MLSAAASASASGGFQKTPQYGSSQKVLLFSSLRSVLSLRSARRIPTGDRVPLKCMDEVNENNSSGFVSVLRLRLEPLCVACAAFETTFLAAHWQLVCPGVTVWLFQVCPSPCGRRHKHACSHMEKKQHVFKAWIWMRIILFISTNFRKKNWQTFSSKETLIPKTNSYLGAQGHI